ncbi:hypothetical protein FHS18_003312 [Paenibacillus phyllosphaerae]|uniref:Carbohydrate-binding domain-containing protein n=1 Tax=Paenibacillus phyllosphaerae TaxID=274593 RepID=A0A7W5AYR9_9BACL|nr:carbohydrate-binding family 9-like protein [Paenibacillus phyllosphaerae]MBB3111244.1 hypothetical protein [Paenibacillus phyllosphaerae]
MENNPVRVTPVYPCQQLSVAKGEELTAESIPWERFVAVELVDTVTVQSPLERTQVRACWTTEHLHIRFTCWDSYIHSTYTMRDEPLYEQDVVEVFIDERGEGTRYMELEVSPYNVIFDAMIENDGNGRLLQVDTSWDMQDLVTNVQVDQLGRILYDIRIPSASFDQPLAAGRSYRVNFYRIDELRGVREYQAWSPTGAVQFHLPAAFGTLVLESSAL